MTSDVVMFGCFLQALVWPCEALHLEKGSHLPAMENTRHKEVCGDQRGEVGMQWLWDQQQSQGL